MSARYAHWIDDDAADDLNENGYLTLEEYQQLQQDVDRDVNNADDLFGGQQHASASLPAIADAMAAVRLSAMVADDDAPSHRCADEVLNAVPAEVEREITRALRRSGEPFAGCRPTVRMELTLQSACGPTPTRLAVAGLKGVYLEDSYFMQAAEQVLASAATGARSRSSAGSSSGGDSSLDNRSDSSNGSSSSAHARRPVAAIRDVRKLQPVYNDADDVDGDDINNNQCISIVRPHVQTRAAGGFAALIDAALEKRATQRKQQRKFITPKQRYLQSKQH